MKNKILDKRGNVAAFDVKYTGEEPSWNDASSLSFDAYYARLTRALGFYAYYCDSGSLLPFVIKWMGDNAINSWQTMSYVAAWHDGSSS
jgi:hypothetical protein